MKKTMNVSELKTIQRLSLTKQRPKSAGIRVRHFKIVDSPAGHHKSAPSARQHKALVKRSETEPPDRVGLSNLAPRSGRWPNRQMIFVMTQFHYKGCRPLRGLTKSLSLFLGFALQLRSTPGFMLTPLRGLARLY